MVDEDWCDCCVRDVEDLDVVWVLVRDAGEQAILWGDADRVVPPAYANRFADLITGPCETKTIDGSGHRVDFDAAEQTAKAILSFLH